MKWNENEITQITPQKSKNQCQCGDWGSIPTQYDILLNPFTYQYSPNLHNNIYHKNTSLLIQKICTLSPQTLHSNTITRDPFNLCKVPFLITQRAYTPSFQPPLDTIQMKYVSTITKRNWQSVIIRGGWVRLVFDGGFVDGITTDCTMFGAGIPWPHGYGLIMI